MGQVVQVDGDRLAAMAQEQAAAGAALDDLAEGVARLLGMVAEGSGGGSLADAARTVAGQWRAGLHLVAEQGHALARATARRARTTRGWSSC
ncbi:hypothetical protein [Serinicoccus kebangsaanensis]|uniref:hypothetical protein n=1 Tax=Serinicoccus kebangsaanensis TaxID=2602069 RepID=UPI00124F1562|nr:hypothetical protein [Serinicoccus kebangsaanensis]